MLLGDLYHLVFHPDKSNGSGRSVLTKDGFDGSMLLF